jgi:CBS-domain-containing membrane protein
MNPLADTLMCPSSGHSIGPEANLREAACLLLQHGHSSLFVTDLHGRLLGRVTEDELLQALFAGTSDLTPAASLAQPVTTLLRNTDTAASARSLLRESLTDCLPVVDHIQTLLGVIDRSALTKVSHTRSSLSTASACSTDSSEDFSSTPTSDWVPETSFDDLHSWSEAPPVRRTRRRRPRPQLRLFNPDEPRPIFIRGAQALSMLRSADDSL